MPLGSPAILVLAALQAAWNFGLSFTQGIGLRPQPRAGFSRPIGPALSDAPTLPGIEPRDRIGETRKREAVSEDHALSEVSQRRRRGMN